jgi:hypothetical protein
MELRNRISTYQEKYSHTYLTYFNPLRDALDELRELRSKEIREAAKNA